LDEALNKTGILRPADVAARLRAASPFAIVLDEPGKVAVELYKPVGVDRQAPHDRDELYVVASGFGRFNRDGDMLPFGPGDLLFVPAHMPHRFEDFSDDFSCWVIFYGDAK
jgi:mannose-6-phosphate isomerase-like protein (cupin superfamily)